VLLAAVGVLAVEAWLKPPVLDYQHMPPAIGEPAPDFALKDLDGRGYHLADQLGRSALVIEFGSASCPYCVVTADGMEDLAKAYAGAADFVFVYCKEAHPDQAMALPGSDAGLPSMPQTREGDDRAQRARAYCSAKQPTAHVLVDVDGPGSVQELYGGGANQVIVIGSTGRVALKQTTANPREIDEWLKAAHSVDPHSPSAVRP
jgi:thiol-disulfide isomerase/thioredoxin